MVLLLSAIAYTILQFAIVRHDKGENSLLAEALGRDIKGKVSIACYAAAIPLAFVNQWISNALYLIVAIIWLIPDRRIEKRFAEQGQQSH